MAAVKDSAPSLSPVRGKLRYGAALAESNWFRVGGPAEVMFRPEDTQDLADFLKHKPADMPHLVLGVGSNVIVRDGGIKGVVIRLGRGFVETSLEADGYDILVTAGAGALGRNLAWWCQERGVAGLEFLSGIPGTVGGAVAMNAGAYGREVKDVLVAATLVTAAGEITTLPADALHMVYRHSDLPEGAVVAGATFRCAPGEPAAIAARIEEIQRSREATQPIRERTGGSTFKNPPGHKAWELIDKAGCRGLTIGGAQMSEKHCNFMINTGQATAADLERLGEEVRRRVKENSGMTLEWEIKRVGTV